MSAASVSSGRERVSCVAGVFKRLGKGRVRGRRFNWKGKGSRIGTRF